MYTINSLISDIDTSMSQLSLFISQFNDIVIANNINVVSDSAGNISIDVPNNMLVETQNNLATRVSIIDRLITDRSSNLDILFKQGFEIEKNLKKTNPNYTSLIAEKAKGFSDLKNKYRH